MAQCNGNIAFDDLAARVQALLVALYGSQCQCLRGFDYVNAENTLPEDSPRAWVWEGSDFWCDAEGNRVDEDQNEYAFSAVKTQLVFVIRRTPARVATLTASSTTTADFLAVDSEGALVETDWTVDQFKGKWFRDSAGVAVGPITGNTASTDLTHPNRLTFATVTAPAAGEAGIYSTATDAAGSVGSMLTEIKAQLRDIYSNHVASGVKYLVREDGDGVMAAGSDEGWLVRQLLVVHPY